MVAWPKGNRLIDLTGRRFGMLVVIERDHAAKSQHTRWVCQCDCGKQASRAGSDLKAGDTWNCGCSGFRQHWEPIPAEDGSVGIPLTQGKVAWIDARDLDTVRPHVWSTTRFNSKATFYALGHIDDRAVSLHRFLTNAASGEVVDHADGDGLNNRRSNLRITTHAANMRNTRKRTGTSSRYKGVSWDGSRSKWQAYLSVDGRRIVLGRFDREEDAARAYDVAAKQYHKDFAKLNFAEGVLA